MTARTPANGAPTASSTTLPASRFWSCWKRATGSRSRSRTAPAMRSSSAAPCRAARASPQATGAPGAAWPDGLVLGGDERQLAPTLARLDQPVHAADRERQRLLNRTAVQQAPGEERGEGVAGAEGAVVQARRLDRPGLLRRDRQRRHRAPKLDAGDDDELRPQRAEPVGGLERGVQIRDR